MSADRQPAHLYPPFREKIVNVMTGMNAWCAKHKPGYGAFLAEGFRTTERQQELYAQGRTKPGDIVTKNDGVKNPSNHQSCLAADICLARGGQPTWDIGQDAWNYLAHLAAEQGLTAGHRWKSFQDDPHIEWPTSDKAIYDAAREWKREQGLA